MRTFKALMGVTVFSVALLSGVASAEAPAFVGTINITGDLDIALGQTTTLTADWAATNDKGGPQNVTRCEWLVDGVSQGVDEIDAASGSSTFDFTPAAVGTYQVCFHIWHHTQTERDATACVTISVTNECVWEDETAWADGFRYVEQGNWATYTPYEGEAVEVDLFAGQDMDAGDVSFSDPEDDGEGNLIVTITITLDTGWRFQDDGENVKIQDYEAAPSGTPSPGQFDHKGYATGSTFSIEVPANYFYGIHVDVEHCVPAP